MSKEQEQEKSPLIEAQRLGLITAPPTSLEIGWDKLDNSINNCVKNIKQMRMSVRFLKKHMDHPFHIEAFNNIESLIDEALIPYLADVDKEFRNIAPT